MADFRKWILVLAVLVAMAVPVSAQTAFSCATTPTTPVLIRQSGLTELVGAVQMECSGGTLGATSTANIQIFMSPTQVTNRVKASATECPTGFACVTDALLTVTTATGTVQVPGLLQKNLVPGVANNAILFPNIALPQGTTSTIRIENVRVAAPAVSSTLIPSQVFELVSTSPLTAFPITNPQQLVAFVQPALVFTTSETAVSFPQCVSQVADKTAFSMTFTEGFSSAFKDVDQESGVPNTGVTTAAGVAAPSAAANTGTLLVANFNNIPAGVTIFVSDVKTAGTATLTATRIDAPSGAKTATINIGTPEVPVNIPFTSVAITSGSGTASWEVSGSDLLGNPESITFGVAVSFTANPSAGLPEISATPGTVSGLLGPTSLVTTASTTAAIPRFSVNQSNGSVTLSIIPCVTNLLFPFITNVAGFDTGIALVNTSLDNAGSKQPFNTNSQNGTCTVFYFNGTTTAPAPQTTPNIAAGAMFAFNLLSGGIPGATSSTAGFQGYAIARCNFQYGHGFAFISDRNTPSLGSQGYLALVIPDRTDGTRPPAPFTSPDGSVTQGEQLAQ